MSSRSLTFGLSLLAGFVFAGCGGPTPEKVGDECEPDGDPCPSGTVCTKKSGDEYTCQIPPGGECNPGGTDYCIGDSVCTETADGGGICGTPEGGTCDPDEPYCTGDLQCVETEGGEDSYKCWPSVNVTGMVFDASSTDPIEGAHVIALDDQSTAISDVGISDAGGNYTIAIPVPRKEDGSPVEDYIFTLRASAQDYQTFPGGIRTSLPITTDEAVENTDGGGGGAGGAGGGDGEDEEPSGGWTIQSALTDIALIELPAGEQGLASISGAILAEDGEEGVLVVAESGDGVGYSAISDLSGAYTIFNVPDGSYEVRGYAAGLQLVPESVSVGGDPLENVDLAVSDDAVGSISGSINIVNAPGGSASSVVLVVESTFSETFVRGEVPRGLRTPLSGPPDVDGAFSIEGVPAGQYVVLAAFENDELVRDPDPNIAGTQIVTVGMDSPGSSVTLDSSFKVTEALAVESPGADDPTPVTSAPMLTWADDSSEEFYTVVVYNAYGDLVWCLSDEMMGCDGGNIPGVSGSGNVSVEYGGPLEPGMYYQFRATSWRQSGNQPAGPISTTEDLLGVFYVDVTE